MKLEDLGYTEKLEQLKEELQLHSFDLGRVIAEHKERYIVKTAHGEFESEITGNIRFTANRREDFPAVGDWVAVAIYDSDLAIIHKILPRTSILKRQAVEKYGEIQIIAANIDYGFIVQSVDRDFNFNRIERYLTICYASKVNSILLLTKTDLISEKQLSEILNSINLRIKDVPVIAISNTTQKGYEKLEMTIEKGKTYCMLGSSGVGKSSLINNLSGYNLMKTGSISESTQKGKHVTSHRELIVIENGGILIDNPGMREVGIVDSASGLEATFDKIVSLSENCKFKNCTHTKEKGCAVLDALEKGALDRSVYFNYLKIEREKAHFDSTVAEKRKKEKDFGKMVKKFKKDLKKLPKKS